MYNIVSEVKQISHVTLCFYLNIHKQEKTGKGEEKPDKLITRSPLIRNTMVDFVPNLSVILSLGFYTDQQIPIIKNNN